MVSRGPWPHGIAVVVAGAALVGCPVPPGGPPPSQGSGGPASAGGPPPIEGSACARLSSADGVDESAGALEPCPDSVDDAILVEWHPAIVVMRLARSSVFFHVKNLLYEEITVEYQVTTAMQGGGDTFEMPLLNRGIRTHASRGGEPVQVDLQLGYTRGVLHEGEVEIVVSARLIEPVQTPWLRMARAVVQTKLDDDGYVYDIDYVEW